MTFILGSDPIHREDSVNLNYRDVFLGESSFHIVLEYRFSFLADHTNMSGNVITV